MRNITVSVDDETYRRARIKAAEQATSVSSLVKGFLTALAIDESEAAARALGCEELLSEDMAHGRQIDGVRIRDPFR